MNGGSMFDSCSFTHQFKINLAETKDVAIGHSVSSGDISAGGHLWRINCYPRGIQEEADDKGKYLSIFLELVSESMEGVKAVLEAFVMCRDGTPSWSRNKRCVHVYETKGICNADWGWPRFVKRSLLESLYLKNGAVIIMCGVKVPLADVVPPFYLGRQLSVLLDSAAGSDVSFVVGGEEFPAHRAVLAARSPVFKAQLLGSMADAKMESITSHDIAPATFRAMLRFIYTDNLPEGKDEDDEDSDEDEGKLDKDDDAELDGSPTDTFRDLLAAADRYALDRLKILCAKRLWKDVSTDTIGATLACAETYNCPELKKKCMDFFVDEKNFKKAVLTDGFAELVQKFPSILAELRVKVGA